MKYISNYDSPLGVITLASDGYRLTGLWFEGQKYDREGLAKDFRKKDLQIFKITKDWLDTYFGGKNPDFRPRIKVYTSDFRKEVYSILEEIPYGQTRTYQDIAFEISKKRNIEKFSPRPVGGAIGHNPISIIIPCHRVLGKEGELRGYAGGLDRKIKLLELENIHTYKK